MKSVLLKITAGLLLAVTGSSCRMVGMEQTSALKGGLLYLPSRITFLNWNAQKGQGKSLPGALKDVVDTFEPDLVFLQEAKQNFWTDEYASGVFAESWKYPWPGGDTVGVLTASVVQADDALALPTRHREFFVTAPKVSLASHYPLADGSSLLAVNVHCLNFERWGTLKLRAQLADLKQAMHRHQGPMLVAGDFNTWNARRSGLVEAFARELGLKELMDILGPVKTGDQGGPTLNRFLGIDPQLPLDRIFYRGLEVESACVVDSDASDHKAILATFRLAGS